MMMIIIVVVITKIVQSADIASRYDVFFVVVEDVSLVFCWDLGLKM